MRQFKNTKTITDRSSASVGTYLRDLSKIPLITVDEEVVLAQKIHLGGPAGERAKQQLVAANLRFVVSVANAYSWCGMDMADLIAEGNVGLIKAAELFDETRGFKFISYAVHWIRQSINAAIAANERTIRLPLNQQAMLQKYNRMVKDYLQNEQRMPTAEEFAAHEGIDIERANAIISFTARTISMDAPLNDDTDCSCLGDLIPSVVSTDSCLDNESLTSDVNTVLNDVLSVREREILIRSFGINCNEQSPEEIADSFGISRERVRQLKEKAIRRLRLSPQTKTLAQHLS